MKKRIALSAGLIGGCASAPAQSATKSTMSSVSAAPEPETLEKRTVAIIQPMDHPSLNQIRETILSEFTVLGLEDKIEVVCRNANGDNSALPTIFSELIGGEADLLIPDGGRCDRQHPDRLFGGQQPGGSRPCDCLRCHRPKHHRRFQFDRH